MVDIGDIPVLVGAGSILQKRRPTEHLFEETTATSEFEAYPHESAETAAAF
jgi:hypothetical protein